MSSGPFFGRLQGHGSCVRTLVGFSMQSLYKESKVQIQYGPGLHDVDCSSYAPPMIPLKGVLTMAYLEGVHLEASCLSSMRQSPPSGHFQVMCWQKIALNCWPPGAQRVAIASWAIANYYLLSRKQFRCKAMNLVHVTHM